MESIRAERVQDRIFLLFCLSALSLFVFQHAAAGEESPPRSLQEELDRRCRDLYASICKEGRKEFCDERLNPVARKGVGTTAQRQALLRCYDSTAVAGDEIDTSAEGVYCVDNCGKLMRCKGTVKRALGSFHASRHEDIEEWIEDAKTRFCSPLQSELDTMCASRAPGSVGRLSGGSIDSSVGCVSADSVVFEETGYCFNGCGFPSLCPGRPNDKSVGGVHVELTDADKSQLLYTFTRPCKSYEVCKQELGEAVECQQENEINLEMDDDLQHWLDEKCRLAVRDMCATKRVGDICDDDATVVMKKGYGHKGQLQHAFRCYDERKIEHVTLVNTSAYGVKCLDNCGVEVPCGGTVNLESVEHVSHSGIEGWINEALLMFCSPFQKALQNVCNQVLPGSLARYGISTLTSAGGPVDDRWRCVKPPYVVYEGVGRCLNNCGGISSCHGGRQATTAADSTMLELLSPEQVDAALEDVVSPCSVTDVCVPSSRNPPTCEPVEYEAGGGNIAATMVLADGDTLSTEFTSEHVTVMIGACFRVKIDMNSRRVTVGRGTRETILATTQATPPFKLLVHRSGTQVTLTLTYESNSGSRSLFYVQPTAACVETNPVTVAGLEEEARLSRSTVKSISSSAL